MYVKRILKYILFKSLPNPSIATSRATAPAVTTLPRTRDCSDPVRPLSPTKQSPNLTTWLPGSLPVVLSKSNKWSWKYPWQALARECSLYASEYLFPDLDRFVHPGIGTASNQAFLTWLGEARGLRKGLWQSEGEWFLPPCWLQRIWQRMRRSRLCCSWGWKMGMGPWGVDSHLSTPTTTPSYSSFRASVSVDRFCWVFEQ